MTTLEKERTEGFKIKMPSRAEYYNTQEEQSGSFRFTPAMQNDELTRIYTDNEELKRDIETGNPDILPTGATLKMLRQRDIPRKPFDDEKEISFKVNSKGKLLFSLYAVVVLSLILIIVLNAVAIERQSAQNTQIENEIAQLSDTIDDLEGQSDTMLQTSAITAQAESFGMQPVEKVSVQMSIPEPAQAVEDQPVTNWFDWLCGLFS
jgi:cell division protein FtsL